MTLKTATRLLGITVALGLAQSATALDNINLTLGEPVFKGDGCTADTTEIALTEDKQTLSILFEDFQVHSMKPNENQRKKCDIRVPVKVPAGYSISIITSEYRGFNFLPAGATATLAADYFLVGVRGPSYKWNFPDTSRDPRTGQVRYPDAVPAANGILKGEYYRKTDIAAEGLVYGPCGKDTTISIKSSLDVTSNKKGDKSDSTLDSLDLTTKTPILYKLTWRACKS